MLLALRANLFAVLTAIERRRWGGVMQAFTDEEKRKVRPWRAREAVIMASLDTVIAGLGYLL